MSEADRMREDASVPGALRDALRDAGAEKAPQEVVKHVLGGVASSAGAAMIGTQAASSTAPGPAALFGGSLLVKGAVALAIFAAGGVVGGYTVHHHDLQANAVARATPPPETPVVAPHEAVHGPSVPPTAQQEALAASARAPGAVEAPPATPAAASPKRVPPPVVAAGPEPGFAPSEPAAQTQPMTTRPGEALRKQFASLQAIRDAVDAHQPVAALASISAHRASFPDTPFDQELLLLEARARAAQHDPATCDVIARFVREYPKSLLAPRVRTVAEEAGCSPSPSSSRP